MTKNIYSVFWIDAVTYERRLLQSLYPNLYFNL